MKPTMCSMNENIQQTLQPDCILYVYSKNGSGLKKQESYLKSYCKMWMLNPIKIYKDSGVNRLDNKPNLKKLLLENTDKDIIILNNSRLSRDTFDMFNISDICKENNLRFFSARENNYLFDEFFSVFKKEVTRNIEL